MIDWLDSLTDITWRSPWAFALFSLPPLALWLHRRQGTPSVRFAPSSLLGDGFSRSWRTRFLFIPPTLRFLGLCSVVLALAGPARPVTRTESVEGVEIFLCLDVSSSMSARDLDAKRSRLEVAKDAALRFLDARPDDRVGLIVFARYPDLRCPPTLDHDALREILGSVTLVASDGPEDATGIGAAAARAAQLFSRVPAKSKIAVLLTDGEENVATEQNANEIAPRHAAQLCQREGIRVYAIAAGAGSPAPGAGRQLADTTQIREMAERTGGRFFAARDAESMFGIYAAIDAMEKAPLGKERLVFEDRFLPFLLAGIFLLVSSRLLEGLGIGVLP